MRDRQIITVERIVKISDHRGTNAVTKRKPHLVENSKAKDKCICLNV